jgi:hypothetical protein
MVPIQDIPTTLWNREVSSRVSMTLDGVFGLDIAFIYHLRIVTTSILNGLTELHNPNITVTKAHIVFSVFTSRFLATDFNTGTITVSLNYKHT